jgi:hypothetical protein
VKKATPVRWAKLARPAQQVQLGQPVPLVLQDPQARADLKAPKATQPILDPTRPPQLAASSSSGGAQSSGDGKSQFSPSCNGTMRARRNTTTISWRLQAIAPHAMARRRS